jgi:CRISPR-associated protein Csb2
MLTTLLISARFHDGRYHGRGDWPPSPARLFQALVAGAAHGEAIAAEDLAALAWLETLAPPVIAAPAARAGQGFRSFVPNNDLDAVGGDPRRVSEIRAAKVIRPVLFDAGMPVVYAWTFDDAAEAGAHAERICTIAERLYQLGRGVDMAWGCAEVLAASEGRDRLDGHGGAVHRPSEAGNGMALAVPLKGSLDSLVRRHRSARTRFQAIRELRPTAREPGREVEVGRLFAQPTKPRFRQMTYDSPPRRPLFDLLDAAGERCSWPLDRIVELTELVRDKTAERLKGVFKGKAAEIDRYLVGRSATEADKAHRVRITPLPSIGHRHADRAIRRVLVEVPASCPLRADNLEWALSGLPLRISDDGEIVCELAPATDGGMLTHYGLDDAPAAHLWRTVTPAALPQHAARRRIDPARRRAEVKGGVERAKEEATAAEATAAAVVQALRHAGGGARPVAIRVQREPFEPKGARAEAFAPGTRFATERLWHAEVAFATPVRGPLAIGDGRYLGLGVLRPVREVLRDVLVFPVPEQARVECADSSALVLATRRALMALSRETEGDASRLFSGHEPDGSPAASGRHEHVFLAADDNDDDGRIDRIVVAAPWACDHAMRPGRHLPRVFDTVVSRLRTLRAGRLGVMTLAGPEPLPEGDSLVGPSRVWESRTPYRATRHAGRRKDAVAALEGDLVAECQRRRLPKPAVEMLEVSFLPNGNGLRARARLRFAVAVKGPLLLGRDSHRGGGLFAVARGRETLTAHRSEPR